MAQKSLCGVIQTPITTGRVRVGQLLFRCGCIVVMNIWFRGMKVPASPSAPIFRAGKCILRRCVKTKVKPQDLFFGQLEVS